MSKDKIKIVLETVDQYNILSKTANEILSNKAVYIVFQAVAKSIGQPVKKQNCPICILDIKSKLKQLRKQLKRDQMAKKRLSKKYEMKTGVNTVFQGAYVNSENITDQLARELLKARPNAIHLFTKYPTNLEEDIETKPKVEQKETQESESE